MNWLIFSFGLMPLSCVVWAKQHRGVFWCCGDLWIRLLQATYQFLICNILNIFVFLVACLANIEQKHTHPPLQLKLGQDDWLWDRENHHDSWHFENLGQQQVTWRREFAIQNLFHLKIFGCFIFGSDFFPSDLDSKLFFFVFWAWGIWEEGSWKNHQSRRMYDDQPVSVIHEITLPKMNECPQKGTILKGNFHAFSSSNHQCLGDTLVFREVVDGVQHLEANWAFSCASRHWHGYV